jgi:AcrR family transcriptional regulator
MQDDIVQRVKRLPRTESQKKTRGVLIARAKTLFLRDGYHLTSLEKVAEHAGYSKGAVYSNFRSKDELCLAVLDAIHDSEVTSIASALGTKGSFEARLRVLEKWAERMIGDAGWTELEIQFAIHARRDAKLAKELASRAEGVRNALAMVLAAESDGRGAPALLPPEVLATALLSLGIGIGVQRLLDPKLSITPLTDTFRALLGRAKPRSRIKKRS